MEFWSKLNRAPHVDFKPSEKLDFKNYLVLWWTDDYDCSCETEYWYCIKDDLFDISALKAKRRYEINKGNKNFTTKLILANDYADEIYNVYAESMKGYGEGKAVLTREQFQRDLDYWAAPECRFFGAFSNETGKLCGYADVWLRTPYLPLSSLKTIPECERDGVNFSLIYKIIEYFSEDIKNGSYLCDGTRNSRHQTNFQDFLIKYFGFRRAYCTLHLRYRFPLKPFIKLLCPIRAIFKNKMPRLYALLRMDLWSRGKSA